MEECRPVIFDVKARVKTTDRHRHVRPGVVNRVSEQVLQQLADTANYGSLPAFEYEGEWYLSDGHTRAFAAGLAGADTLRTEADPTVREECDFEVYRTCIRWCADAGIETVHDLRGRVVEPDTYERCWIKRCQAITNDR